MYHRNEMTQRDWIFGGLFLFAGTVLVALIIFAVKIAIDFKLALDIFFAADWTWPSTHPLANALLSPIMVDIIILVVVAIGFWANSDYRVMRVSLYFFVPLLLLGIGIGQINHATGYPYVTGDPTYYDVAQTYISRAIAIPFQAWNAIYNSRTWAFEGLGTSVVFGTVTYMLGRHSRRRCVRCEAPLASRDQLTREPVANARYHLPSARLYRD